MCGRFAITSPPEAVRAYFRYVEQPNFPPRYNIAPTQPIPIVTAERDARHFKLARWGFLPGFVKDPRDFPLIINARAETLRQKPSFRAALRRRRCLIPADAWYEWRAEGKGRKTPFLLRRRGAGLMGFAGLWETYADPSGGEIDTACIVTTNANGATVAIHDRMPALIEPGDYNAWLDPDETVPPPLHLLRPADDAAIEFFAISPLVNRTVHDGPEIQKPA
ncbi:SOS response-associated peptidase [Rhodoblastus sp.]|uniref:SOS response-associated peptidase n=1 Tax=Rhodoblastus sp. TaxID=1962975 RepID=UPI002611992C|nr:SOS response-associated peptidase [Rhodoblastus sp.]